MRVLKLCALLCLILSALKASDFTLWQDLQKSLKTRLGFEKTNKFETLEKNEISSDLSQTNAPQFLQITPSQNSKNSQSAPSAKAALNVKAAQNSQTQDETRKKDEKQDFMQLALENYLGHSKGRNLFGISTYKMNYFMPVSYAFKGRMKDDHRAEVKFQISVKKPLFEDVLGFDETYYFAYTQTSWWQLYKHSSPFREINFAPELFVNVPLKLKGVESLKSVRLGLLHESNGKDDEDLKSRSWNRLYASAIFLRGHVLIEPRVWYRLPESADDDDNPRITHYAGRFDVNVAYLAKDYFAALMLRNNLNFKDNKGALELSFAYDLFSNGVFWYVQGFSGYAERLILYDKNTQRLSIGVLIAY